MKHPVESKIETLEALVKQLHDAAYLVLVESNGVSDNEWTTPDGKAIPEFPVGSFYAALRKLDTAYSLAKAYLEPVEQERSKRWSDACATAAYVVDRLKEEQKAERMHPNILHGSLQRNIADAIYGTLKQTSEDRKAGKAPETMDDKLNQLVADGKLVQYVPNKKP